MEKNPTSVITPWNLGGNCIPKHKDIERIKKYSKTVYITNSDGLNGNNRNNDQLPKIKEENYTEINSYGFVSLQLDSKSGKIKYIQLNGSAQQL